MPEVWIIAQKPKGGIDPAKAWAAEAQAAEWSSKIVHVESRRDSAGKQIHLLDPVSAQTLYKRAHQTQVGVWTLCPTNVQTDPTRHAIADKFLISIARLVRYKAFYASATAATTADVVSDFRRWMTITGCSGESDPRVLPLHMFAPSTDWNDLSTSDGHKRFRDKHGSGNDRVCENDLRWPKDPARHAGRESQSVRGFSLGPGLHWDVTPSRGSATVRSLTEVWKVPQGRHVNVSPNGHIRKGKGSTRVDSVEDESATKRSHQTRKK